MANDEIIKQTIERIKDILTAFQQNNLSSDYQELLDVLADNADNWAERGFHT